MTETTERLARLRRKLATTDDPEDRSDLEAAIAALEAQQPPAAAQSIAGSAQVGVAVAGSIHGNVYLDGRRADGAAKLLADYLARLRGRCAAMPLEGLRQQKQVGDVLAISLDQVYTQLTVPGTVQRESFAGAALRTLDIEAYITAHTGDDILPWQRRISLRRPLTSAESKQAARDASAMMLPGMRLTAAERHQGKRAAELALAADDLRAPTHTEEALRNLDCGGFRKNVRSIKELAFFGPRLVTDAIADYSRLVLLGEPGSGKSTVLRYLALTLAEAGLEESVDLAARLAGWERFGSEQRLLPVFLPLLPLAQRIARQGLRAGTADELWRYVADQLEPGNVRTGLAEAVHAELAAGRVLLLLDGLDEVAGAESRQQVVRAVAQFAREYGQCRMVVTCRVRAYEGQQNAAWQLAGWATTTLEPWDRAQMHHFVAAWYDAAVQAGGLPEAQRADRVGALQRAIAASGDLQRLADRPLLLTIMALVHLNDGRLPEDRVALYSRCVDILLGQWELRGKEQSDYGALMDYLGLPDRDVQRLRPLLTRAAFEAHQAGTADSPGVLGRETLRWMAADHLEQIGHSDPHRGARKFLEYTDLRAGLIQATDAGDAYAFPHLTFQEYLAGLELTSGVGVVKRIMDHRANDRWRVPILLGIGDYVSGNKLELPYQLLRELLDAEEDDEVRRQRDLLFAAEIAADVGWDRLEQGGATFKKLRRDLAAALAVVVEGTALPAPERVRASVLLGSLGDPRPGVCTLPPAMVRIEGGTFMIGESYATKQYDDEINDQSLILQDYAIARYLVTNAQFAIFINDRGYEQSQSWSDAAGKAWLRRFRRQQPSQWDDERFGKTRPNCPVVAVTWYEAMAFCRWLTATLNDGYTYTLPSEAEWEYASRATTRRPYPWGLDEPDGEQANFNQMYNGTTAVGCFSRGATPEGLLDMAGNVWEWTRSEYRPYPYDPNDGRELLDDPAQKTFTLRGGSWDSQPLGLRACSRDYFMPGRHFNHVGFRVARHRVRSQ
jgi:formylglycine-generating enzyme required for sulfatase activity